jgi:hypothetical protein
MPVTFQGGHGGCKPLASARGVRFSQQVLYARPRTGLLPSEGSIWSSTLHERTNGGWPRGEVLGCNPSHAGSNPVLPSIVLLTERRRGSPKAASRVRLPPGLPSAHRCGGRLTGRAWKVSIPVRAACGDQEDHGSIPCKSTGEQRPLPAC